jgi:hypothetical protein
VIHDAAEAGIAVSVMNFLGFPGETGEEARETIEFLRANRASITSFALGRFRMSEFSPVQREPATFGVAGVRRFRSQWVHPRFLYTPTGGRKSDDLQRHPTDGVNSLTRDYPRQDAFLDGPVGVHALIHMVERNSRKFEEIFPLPPVPGDIFRCKPRLPENVVAHVDAGRRTCLLQNLSTGSWWRTRWPARWLSLATGNVSIDDLIVPVARRSSVRSGEDLASEAGRIAARYVDLYQLGFLELVRPAGDDPRSAANTQKCNLESTLVRT